MKQPTVPVLADLKPYPTYKDSGVPWLGEVPGHWELSRTKRVLRERREKGHPSEPLLSATQTKGVVRKDQYENRTVMALKDLHLLKLVHPDDFVISLRSFQGGIEHARERGIISPAYTVLCPFRPETHGFLSWLFKSRPFIENLSLHVTGIRQGQNVDYERLSRSELPLPPLSEQTPIVRYLDYMDRRIRRYIRAKQKLIKLLNDQKQAIIHKAVTRGLDPNVRLKPSGVQWTGEIPEHWEVRRNGQLFVQRNEIGFPGLPILEVSLRTGVRIRDFENSNRKQIMADRAKYKRAAKNDLAYNMMRMWQGAVGVVPVDGLVSPAYVVAVPKEGTHPQYFDQLFHTTTYMREVDAYSRGIVKDRNRLYWEDLKQMPSLYPPFTEQAQIASVIEEETKAISHGIDQISRQISLLREYRTRVISDVVTGKLDVREVAAQLPDEAEESEPTDETEVLLEDSEESIDADQCEPIEETEA